MPLFDPAFTRRELLGLRGSFRQLFDRGCRLLHVMVQAPPDRDEAMADRPVGCSSLDTRGAGTRRFVDPGPPIRAHYYLDFADESELEDFRSLAAAAGSCIAGWPVQYPGLPFGPEKPVSLHGVRRGRGAEFWMAVVHRIGWQNRPGTALVIVPSELGMHRVAATESRRYREATGREPTDIILPNPPWFPPGVEVNLPEGRNLYDLLRTSIGVPPDCVLSELPQGLGAAECSILAINVIAHELLKPPPPRRTRSDRSSGLPSLCESDQIPRHDEPPPAASPPSAAPAGLIQPPATPPTSGDSVTDPGAPPCASPAAGSPTGSGGHSSLKLDSAHDNPGGQRARPRKKTAKGDAALLLDATLDSLSKNGLWGKTDVQIFDQAGISRDSFYRLKRDNDSIKKKLAQYRAWSRGRGPVRPGDV
jgi:hypothetical protein